MLNFKTLATGVLLTGTFAAAIPATATEVQTQIQASQLTTQQGIAATFEYLEDVATEECGVDDAFTLSDRRTAKNCADNLLEDFIESVDNQDLTQLFNIKT